MATRRARQIANGVDPMVEWENDKPTVVALREIAEGHINARTLEELEMREAEIQAQEELAAELEASEG